MPTEAKQAAVAELVAAFAASRSAIVADNHYGVERIVWVHTSMITVTLF